MWIYLNLNHTKQRTNVKNQSIFLCPLRCCHRIISKRQPLISNVLLLNANYGSDSLSGFNASKVSSSEAFFLAIAKDDFFQVQGKLKHGMLL